jgi:hypothetical protein
MRKEITHPEDLFVTYAKEVEALFQQAVQRALWRHKRLGNPVAVWENGQVVIVPPEEIVIDEAALNFANLPGGTEP